MDQYDKARIAPPDVIEALSLLTRLPVYASGERGIHAAWAWPLAGLAVGLAGAFAAWIALGLGLPVGLAAALALAAQIMATGAMHEDGLADCADGFWGGQDHAARLEIMRDSRIGTYGTLALILDVLLRWLALSYLFEAGHVWAPLLAVAVLSRIPMVAMMGWMAPARADGLSASLGAPDRETILIAAIAGMIAALLFAGHAAFPAAILAALAALATGQLARARIGGQTGDVLGASQQLAEIAALATFAALWA